MAVSLCALAAAAGALLGLAPAPWLPAVTPLVAPPAPRGHHLSEHIQNHHASAVLDTAPSSFRSLPPNGGEPASSQHLRAGEVW